jgi:RNA-directed DNA polymerase
MQNSFHQNLEPAELCALYKKHFAEKYSAGIDGVTNKQFAKNLDQEVDIIRRKATNLKYSFSCYREKLILKGAGSNPRVISVPTNRDKLLLKSLFNFLRETFESDINDEHIQRKILDIISQIKSNRYDSFIKLDIIDFFPNVKHDLLLDILSEKITDEVVLNLVEKAIKKPTVAVGEKGANKPGNEKGVPQGLSISGLLASIYLSHIDQRNNQQDHFQYYRFVDDILILCNAGDVEKIRNEIKHDLEKIGLALHPPKKNSSKSSDGTIEEGFQFLGYLFEGKRVSVRPSSLDKIYRGINQVFLDHYKYPKNIKKKKKKKKKEKERLKNLHHFLNLKITGCRVYEVNGKDLSGKQYGWLYFFSLINDQTLLFKLDAHVKRACKRFGVPYDSEKIKKFSRAYYELRKKKAGKYIPTFINTKTLSRKDVWNLRDYEKKDYERLLKKADLEKYSDEIDEVLSVARILDVDIDFNRASLEREKISQKTIDDMQSDIDFY